MSTPIVFVPGLLCSAEVFAPQLAALWPYGPTTVASTLSQTTMTALAASILEDAPRRFALVGISMGGYIALEIMRQAPERVIRLALLDTSARPDSEAQIGQRRKMVADARSGDFTTLAAKALTAILHPAHQDDPALRAVNARMAQSVGLEGFARQTEVVISRPDSRPGLATIAVPTLVLVGAQDTLTPLDCATEIADAINGARLVVIEECGHGSTLEQPDAVSGALIDWIIAQ